MVNVCRDIQPFFQIFLGWFVNVLKKAVARGWEFGAHGSVGYLKMIVSVQAFYPNRLLPIKSGNVEKACPEPFGLAQDILRRRGRQRRCRPFAVLTY